MKTRIALAVALAVLATAATVSAQQVQPVTYVAEFNVKLEKAEQFLDLVKKYDQPTFDKLMAEGAVLAWGVDIPMLHEPGGATHSFWWTSPDLAAFDKVFAALEAQEKIMMETDRKAAEEARKKGRPAPKSGLEQFLEAIDLGKHKDWLFRDLIIGGSGAPLPAGAQPYGWITFIHVQPGKGDEFRKLWVEYYKPVYDKLVADGTIYGYSLGVEEAKSTDAFTHYVYVSLPNLAAREKMLAAFRADREARTAAERSMMMGSFQSVVDASATRNYLLRSIIIHTSPPK